MITWPDTADQDSKNPKFIEKFLRDQILNSQITLVGELDLTTPTHYGGTGWSLAALAEYLIEKPVIGSNLTRATNEVLDYAATIVVWAVSRAQNLEDGTELWKNSVLPDSKLSKVAEKFTLAIQALGLETFEGMLEGRQRHITLARLHAMIPIYATSKYVDAIRIGHKYHRPKEVILQSVLDNETIPIAVKLLFETEKEIALDLIDRSLQVLSTGKNAGLPKRLNDALLENFSPVFTKKKELRQYPAVIFSQSDSEVYVDIPNGWRIQNDNQNIPEFGNIPLGITLALGPAGTSFKLLDTSKGYLIFTSDGMLLESNYLPNDGGMVLLSDQYLVTMEDLATEQIPMANWPKWLWAIVRPNVDLKITDASGKEHLIRSKRGIQIEEFIVPQLLTRAGNPVATNWPVVGPNQILRAIDNSTGNEIELRENSGNLQIGAGGVIDISIFAGMGKSRNINQLVIPGLIVENIERPMVYGEKRDVRFKFPENWVGPELLVIDSAKIEQTPLVSVKDHLGNTHEIFIKLPILNWTIEFENQEFQKMYTFGKYRLEDMKRIKSLVLHDTNTKNLPNLRIIETAKNTIGSRVAISHGGDFRFDLRTLRDSSESKEIKIDLNVDGKVINLCAFRTKQIVVLKDFRDLEAGTIAAEFFTEEDWKNFRNQQAKEEALIKMRNRSFRRGYR